MYPNGPRPISEPKYTIQKSAKKFFPVERPPIGIGTVVRITLRRGNRIKLPGTFIIQSIDRLDGGNYITATSSIFGTLTVRDDEVWPAI